MPYENGEIWEGRIYLFDSHTNSVEQIAKFTSYSLTYEVATTKDKVDYFISHCQFYNFRFLQLTAKNHLKSLI